MPNQKNDLSPSSLSSQRRRVPQGYSTPQIFLLTVTAFAALGLSSGYVLQLNSRLALAESELRLIRVTEQLLSQELEMERVLKSAGGYDYRDLSRFLVIPLSAVSSSWHLKVNFEVLWDPKLRQGVLILDGKVENSADYEIEFLAHFPEGPKSNVATPIPTTAVPSSPRRRWFEISDTTNPSISGFELVMRLSDDSKDTVRFLGKLPEG